jgi:hypothetical protein
MESIQKAANQAQETVRQGADKVSQTAKEMTDKAGQAMGQAKDSAGQTAEQVGALDWTLRAGSKSIFMQKARVLLAVSCSLKLLLLYTTALAWFFCMPVGRGFSSCSCNTA